MKNKREKAPYNKLLFECLNYASLFKILGYSKIRTSFQSLFQSRLHTRNWLSTLELAMKLWSTLLALSV